MTPSEAGRPQRASELPCDANGAPSSCGSKSWRLQSRGASGAPPPHPAPRSPFAKFTTHYFHVFFLFIQRTHPLGPFDTSPAPRRTDKELDRRRDMLTRLKDQAADLARKISRKPSAAGGPSSSRRRGDSGLDSRPRIPAPLPPFPPHSFFHPSNSSAPLLAASSAGEAARPEETAETAALDERGLLGLQQQARRGRGEDLDESCSNASTSVLSAAAATARDPGPQALRDQDTQLDALSRAAESTKARRRRLRHRRRRRRGGFCWPGESRGQGGPPTRGETRPGAAHRAGGARRAGSAPPAAGDSIRFDSIRSDPIRSGSRAARICRSRPEPARRTRGAAQDDLEDAVEHTGGRLSLAQNRLKILMRKSSECKARRRGSDPRIRIRQAGG